MYQSVSDSTFKALQAIDGPSICNAIEGLNFRPKNQGFMLPEIKSIYLDQSISDEWFMKAKDINGWDLTTVKGTLKFAKDTKDLFED